MSQDLLSEEEIAKKKRLKSFKKYLSIATDTADILATIAARRPTILGVVSVGLKLINSYETVTEKDSSDSNFFIESGWKPLNIGEFKKFVYSVLISSMKPQIIDGKNEDSNSHMIFDLGENVKIGFVQDSQDVLKGPYVEKIDDQQKILAKIGRLSWEFLGTKNACVHVAKGSYDDYGREDISFVADDLESNVFSSEVALGILSETELFLDKNFNRSIMFHGDPGTGKTSAMKFIAKKMGKFSLRISVTDLSSYSDALVNAVAILQPTILMIDDFDRAYKHEQMLTELEKFNQTIKLFMVSVNDSSDMPGAVIRPGRFDDIIEFTKLDDAILESLIGPDVEDSVKKRLKELPIAYIAEFHKRREVLGVERAIEGVEELEKRMKRAKNGGEDDDDKDDDTCSNCRQIEKDCICTPSLERVALFPDDQDG